MHEEKIHYENQFRPYTVSLLGVSKFVFTNNYLT